MLLSVEHETSFITLWPVEMLVGIVTLLVTHEVPLDQQLMTSSNFVAFLEKAGYFM